MKEIATRSERLEETPNGTIFAVSFAGVYPPGSLGNDHAATMKAYVAEVVKRENPAAIVFDLTGLDYTWGDAIMTMVWALVNDGGSFRPSCICAEGSTAKALAPLMEPHFLFGWAGMKLYESHRDGIEYLTSELGKQTG